MKRIPSALLWGIILIVVGVLSLLSNLDILGAASDIVWSALLIGVGIAFLALFLQNRERWWALIPGLGVIGLGLLVAFGRWMPAGTEPILFLGMLALSFVLIYVLHREMWWALLPAGVLLSVCAVVLGSQQEAFDEGVLMLIGLGVTFAAVALLGKPSKSFRWAWIPAAALGIIGLATLLGSIGVGGYVWPVAIILVGAVFLLRAALGKQSTEQPDDTPQPPAAPEV